MNFFKKYKYPLTATLGLIAVIFIFQNGTCNNNGSYQGTNSSGQTGGGGSSAFSVSPLNTTVAPGGRVTLAGIGGNAPYTYVKTFGDGTLTSTGVYTAPSYATVVGITVTDATGAAAYANITVQTSTSTTALNLTAAAYTVNTGATVQLTATGGSGSYIYSVVSGGGSVSGAGLYTAPSTPGTVLVKVESASQTAQVSLTVQNGPGAFTKAESNSQEPLPRWEPIHAIDQYPDSCYSSLRSNTFIPSVKPYLMLTIGPVSDTSLYPISKLNLSARRVGNSWVAFPSSYTVKVLSADGQSWTNVGTFYNQPEFDGIARIIFPQTYYTKKVVIIAEVLTKDDRGTYYYFQVCNIAQ